jgi:hypothetical protein
MTMLDWIRANKEILPIGVAFISSVAALAAVVVAPSIQLWIAHKQFALQKQSNDLTAAQISANIIGVADQKWGDMLRETIAEIEALIVERGVIQTARKSSGDLHFELQREFDIGNRLPLLYARVALLVGSSPEAQRYSFQVVEWAQEEVSVTRAQRRVDVFRQTSDLIERRNSRFGAQIDSVLSQGKNPTLP